MKQCEDFILGVACKGGYYPLGKHSKIRTDKTKGFLDGQYIKHDFTVATHQEIADFLGINIRGWIRIYLNCKPIRGIAVL